GPPVGEAPVAVDERPAEPAGVACDVAVLRERAQVFGDPRRQRVPRVAVVMQVELDLAEPGAREPGELVEEVRAVLLAGEEPAVARRAAVTVAERGERRIARGPDIDALAADVVGRVAPQRLVVVAQR